MIHFFVKPQSLFNGTVQIGLRSAKGVIVALALSCATSPTPAQAVTAFELPPQNFTEGSVGASVFSEYFSSNANYEPGYGSYNKLLGDSSFTTFVTNVRGRYTISSNLSVFSGLAYSSSRAVDLSRSKTNTQFSEWLVGADYLMRFSRWPKFRLIPELILSYCLDQPTSSQINPSTNDGTSYFRTGIFADHPFRRFRFGGYIGVYGVLGSSLSSRALYEINADMRVFSQFTIGGGINGYNTVMGDATNFVTRQIAANRMNAGSGRYAAFDPHLLEGRVWVGFRPDHSFWLRAGYAKTLNGLHTAEGQSFLFSLVYQSPQIMMTNSLSREGTSEIEPVPQKGRKSYDNEEALRTFEPDVEKTDESVFEMSDDEAANSERGKDVLDQSEKMLEKKSKKKK